MLYDIERRLNKLYQSSPNRPNIEISKYIRSIHRLDTKVSALSACHDELHKFLNNIVNEMIKGRSPLTYPFAMLDNFNCSQTHKAVDVVIEMTGMGFTDD